MYYLLLYFSILFTVQVILILEKAPVLWLLAIWSFLLCAAIFFRQKLLYPSDHPHFVLRKQLYAGTLVLLVCLIFSNLYVQFVQKHREESWIKQQLVQQEQQEMAARITGKLTSPPMHDGNRVQFTLEVAKVEGHILALKEKVLVQRYAETEEELSAYQSLKRGTLWSGEVQLKLPEPARNPGAFDYRQHLFQQGIHSIGRISNNNWQAQQNRNWQTRLLQHLDHQRERWSVQVQRIFSDDVAPIILAMTIGDRNEIDPDLLVSYQQLGLIHLLAISGLHVGIIVWCLYALLLKFTFTREKVLMFLFCLLPVYIYISGASVSVTRSGLMAMIVLLCMRFQLWRSSIAGLFLVYIALVVWNPYMIYQIGFQLSFLVTFGLILTYQPVSKLFSSFPEKFRVLFSVSLIAQLFSLPVILYHFYQFSPFSLFLNILFVPVYSILFIPGAFFLTFLSFFSTHLVQLAVRLYEVLLSWTHILLEQILSLPIATLNVGKPDVWWLFLYFSIVIGFLFLLEEERMRKAWLALGLLLFLLAGQWLHPYFKSEAIITVLDVGQGDAIVLELPYRREVVVIDLGGQVTPPQEEWQKRKREFEVGRDIVLPYLRYRGINQIDKLVVTHGHYDHLGGIQGILGEIPITMLLRSPIPPQTDFEQEWIAKALETGIEVRELTRGDEWSSKEAVFHVLYPEKPRDSLTAVENLHDYNLVLFNQIYSTSFLWTGDVEENGEKAMLDNYPALKTDLLKIAHHGSQTSTSAEWIQQVDPQVAIISVGRKNRFGHPHADVVARMERSRADLYRTDQQGGIVIRVHAEGFNIIPSLQALEE